MSFEDVRNLADLATALPFRVWISDGRHDVDAQSLMCMFSLDFREPLALHMECSEEDFEGLRSRLGNIAT